MYKDESALVNTMFAYDFHWPNVCAYTATAKAVEREGQRRASPVAYGRNRTIERIQAEDVDTKTDVIYVFALYLAITAVIGRRRPLRFCDEVGSVGTGMASARLALSVANSCAGTPRKRTSMADERWANVQVRRRQETKGNAGGGCDQYLAGGEGRRRCQETPAAGQ